MKGWTLANQLSIFYTMYGPLSRGAHGYSLRRTHTNGVEPKLLRCKYRLTASCPATFARGLQLAIMSATQRLTASCHLWSFLLWILDLKCSVRGLRRDKLFKTCGFSSPFSAALCLNGRVLSPRHFRLNSRTERCGIWRGHAHHFAKTCAPRFGGLRNVYRHTTSVQISQFRELALPHTLKNTPKCRRVR